MEPLISVVVPVYNVEKFLDRCLDSVVAQTYQNWEVILVDDGSQDKSSEMCDEWGKRDSRFKVIHKQNAGLGMARNTGMENAAGKYICFLDSDDYLDSKILEHASALAEQEDAEVVLFGHSKVDIDGKVYCVRMPIAEKNVLSGNEIQTVLLPDMINNSNINAKYINLGLSACFCLFRMELIQRTGWRMASERDIISEDSYSLMVLYQYVKRVAILQETGYYYCYNQASLTHRYRADRFVKIKHFYNKAVELQEQAGFSIEVKARLKQLVFAFSVEAMKQTVASDKNISAKWKEAKAMICDDLMREILTGLNTSRYNSKIKLLVTALRYKLCLPVFVMVMLQVRKSKASANNMV